MSDLQIKYTFLGHENNNTTDEFNNSNKTYLIKIIIYFYFIGK